MINTIKNALNNEFLIQNFFGFALNEFLSNIQTKTKNTRNEFVLFYEEVLKDFCNKRNWEYDETTIEDNLQLLNISTVSNKTEVAQCLSTLFGTNFLEGEEEQLTNDWCESFNKVLNTHKYNYIEIINIIHSSMENMFQKLVSQTQKVISDNTENEICSNISTALMQMKYSNYSVAQKLLENILPKVANSPYEFSCLFNLGFCLHKLNDFRTSLNYYLQ